MSEIFNLVRDIGSIVSLLISLGVLMSALYSMMRGTPRLIRRLTGVEELEAKIDELNGRLESRGQLSEERTEALVNSMRMSQQLQLQQAKEFNKLSAVLFSAIEHDDEERPHLSPQKIRRLLLEDDTPDFTESDGD